MIRRRAFVPIVLLVMMLPLGGCQRVPGGDVVVSNSTSGSTSGSTYGAGLRDLAVAALGELEGAVLVIDPRTGRLLAVVNPRLAFGQSFPPGSAIKPFSALAALQSGRIPPDWTHRCTGGIRDESGNLLCSHPRVDIPMTIDQAIAWSCNDYFLALGERLGQSAFNEFLRDYGFGERTGINATEQAGHLSDRSLDRREADGSGLHAAIGEGDDLLVTPLQLLRGYQGMVNGGRLCRPVISETLERAGCREPISRPLSEMHRRLIVAGMRGVVTAGTAAGAGLVNSENYIFGKTGTSAASNGFRRHGWFVGFAAPGRFNGVPSPGAVTLGVLVFLRRGTGAEAARVAARILDLKSAGVTIPAAHNDASPLIRIGSNRAGSVIEIPLEDYVAGVVEAEAGHEQQREALRAQAVASRTFAVYNRGRHGSEGYDFCATTHCQRFDMTRRRPAGTIRAVVASTTGELIREPGGGVAEIFYHAACGGHTADIGDVWGVKSGSSYLRGLRGTSDPHCATRPERQWEDRLTIEELERALSKGEGTGALGHLRDLAIERRDRTGRVALIRLRGNRDLVLRGWDFRLIIARTLGWQILKSTRFELSRSGQTFRFRGRGFGHGLGLCQDGAHDLARQGLSYRRILAHYFPGTVIDRLTGHLDEDRKPRMLPAAWGKNPDHRIVTNGNIEWFYHADGSSLGSGVMHSARRILEAARRDLEKRLGRSLSQRIEIHVHGTTAGFIAATGRSGLVAATTRGVRIDLQPPAILERRGILESTLRHEYVHAAIATLNREPIPRWLAEGLAIHFAGEGESFLRYLKGRPRLSRSELESRLAADNPSLQSRYLYAMAYLEVRQIISTRGEAAAWRLATESTTTASRDSILIPMAIVF